MLLSKTTQGKYKIISIFDGKTFMNRLISMGISINSSIEVVDNDRMIPIMIKVMGSEFAMGREMASKIEVIKE